jgi:hypothetical protein
MVVVVVLVLGIASRWRLRVCVCVCVCAVLYCEGLGVRSHLARELEPLADRVIRQALCIPLQLSVLNPGAEQGRSLLAPSSPICSLASLLLPLLPLFLVVIIAFLRALGALIPILLASTISADIR